MTWTTFEYVPVKSVNIGGNQGLLIELTFLFQVFIIVFSFWLDDAC